MFINMPMTKDIDQHKAPEGASFLTETDELVFLLEEVPRRLRQAFDDALKHFSLTRTQWRTLAYVFRTEGLTQTELAHCVELERASIGQAIDRLEELNYVERRKGDSDRRVWQIYLRPSAHQLLPELRREADAVYEKMLNGIAKSERARLHKTLGDLSRNLAKSLVAREIEASN
ncbi:transcriptional regulator, TrmB [Aurantiacibacter atlanticus]|uniref:Transcriptional regulator, TrmB n=1 Tax=Aurantiacibacter atlanticus TaxID=1648404 RepID=A0A0H4W0R5_9SPHN|nr:MarR family transcriptional regulator [Aurantiacibacter atlanticus]AKQ43108.2 transcriptional regulator, TrmB [Aurantiacibacter atlanticus]